MSKKSPAQTAQNEINPPPPRRSARDYTHLSRRIWANHLRTQKHKLVSNKPLHRIGEFLTTRLWPGAWYYLGSRFGRRHAYPDYKGSTAYKSSTDKGATDKGATDKGIYPIQPDPASGRDHVCIAITADWATDTPESVRVAAGMRRTDPDYTAHLGDTYFVGAPTEVQNNFTARGAPWVRGTQGSFAVLGNHEMYARGIAFFDHLLPTLGLRVAGRYQGQTAGFCCLENEHWRILLLDTGYHSIGLPFLEMTSWFGPDCRLDDKLMNWLRDDVKLGDPADRRGLLFFTHHQYISAFREREYTRPARQLAELIGTQRPVLWMWGHEHRLAIYSRMQVAGGVTAYGRCIGHGGMPVELNTAILDSRKLGFPGLVMVDSRIRHGAGTTANPFGYNGYIVLRIKGDQLNIDYCDIERTLFTESWRAPGNGSIQGNIQLAADCPLQPVPGRHWEDAVS